MVLNSFIFWFFYESSKIVEKEIAENFMNESNTQLANQAKNLRPANPGPSIAGGLECLRSSAKGKA